MFSSSLRSIANTRVALSKTSFKLDARRFLNVHEYSGHQIMRQFGVPGVPNGVVASSAEEAAQLFNSPELGAGKKDVVMKAQILAGGRGKGKFKNGFKGGVHVVTSAADAKDYASKMLNQILVTKQTGPDGKKVDKVYMMERLYLRRETYFSIIMDRSHGGPTLVGSPRGGTSIEDVAAETPELIFTEKIDIKQGIKQENLDRMAANLGFEGKAADEAKAVMKKLYDMFIQTDATMVEINPLAETPEGKVYVCDSKLNFDDNAEFRQQQLHSHRDRSQEDPREVEADQYGLNYIGLDGNIGCLVNGAGLAMATMDIIKLHGGSPANFLDVGGGATKSQVERAFSLLNNDKSVKAILVNIFGGIMRCDVIASGIVAAAQTIGLRKPVIIRLQGTNVQQARDIIEASGYRM